ncbi:hypothetical protein [Pseudomonas sp. 5P_3.1_Bac2]|uniref:hypothetical protein n=1 Tax=Pseudomonas sp. 5P_3.1_Bac2 TaxID=2971617 RepID=UPI0021CA70DC|nr:hypothetical protein [Pseudomonas sp. 5P_3.1_Bac2]MCU1716558.1 hypothetical protein [Pseudomonas sp. 5P_3.1_Bac2]
MVNVQVSGVVKGLLQGGLLLALLSAATISAAANQPCSGKKGGVARCDGELFVCKDGSISASKRRCAAGRDGSSAAPLRVIGGDGACACGSGTLCTGPRGGQFCITSSGKKSYKRQ